MIARRLTVPKGKRLYASPDYLSNAPSGAPKRPKDLASHRLLAINQDGAGATWKLGGPDGPTAIAIQPYLSINSMAVLQSMAAAGRGIAMLPVMQAQAAVDDGSLVEVLPDYAPRADGFYAVMPSARRQSASVRAMVEELATRLSEPNCRG